MMLEQEAKGFDMTQESDTEKIDLLAGLPANSGLASSHLDLV